MHLKLQQSWISILTCPNPTPLSGNMHLDLWEKHPSFNLCNLVTTPSPNKKSEAGPSVPI